MMLPPSYWTYLKNVYFLDNALPLTPLECSYEGLYLLPIFVRAHPVPPWIPVSALFPLVFSFQVVLSRRTWTPVLALGFLLGVFFLTGCDPFCSGLQPDLHIAGPSGIYNRALGSAVVLCSD